LIDGIQGKGNSIQTVKNTAMHDIIKEIYKFPGQTGRRMLSERGMDLTGNEGGANERILLCTLQYL
jgi:hypothetical protein